MLLAASAAALLAAAPPPAMTVEQILARMSENYAGITTYQVPVQINAHIRAGISLPVSMTGTRYFKAPAKEALKMNSVPAIAKAFQDVYASLGTPQTWPMTYNITVVTPSISSERPIYEMRGVYKRSAKVDHVLLDVDAATFEPVEARWFYTNGATIVMNIQEKIVDGKHPLPAHETLNVAFPQYKGDADVVYGDYVLNQAIPDSVFTKT